MNNKKILIAVPAYNEQENIARVIQEIKNSGVSAEILVIDDGSKDQTSSVSLENGAKTIKLPFNLGIGGAVQTAFVYAVEQNCEVMVQLDGDGQHDASYLPVLLKPIFDGRANVVVGSRFVPPFVGYQSSFWRRIGIHFFAWLISFLAKTKVTDPTSGFRAFDRAMIRVFAKYYPHDFPEPEALAVARRFGARIVEVPVCMRERLAGNSSIRYLKTAYYMIKVTFAILLDQIKPKGDLSHI